MHPIRGSDSISKSIQSRPDLHRDGSLPRPVTHSQTRPVRPSIEIRGLLGLVWFFGILP